MVAGAGDTSTTEVGSGTSHWGTDGQIRHTTQGLRHGQAPSATGAGESVGVWLWSWKQGQAVAEAVVAAGAQPGSWGQPLWENSLNSH